MHVLTQLTSGLFESVGCNVNVCVLVKYNLDEHEQENYNHTKDNQPLFFILVLLSVYLNKVLVSCMWLLFSLKIAYLPQSLDYTEELCPRSEALRRS